MSSSEWGLDVFRLLTSDIEKLIERENELLNTSEPPHSFRVTHTFYVHSTYSDHFVFIFNVFAAFSAALML